ncbi:hypothetical protein BsWGS_23405 [Bradybaena similaris]
MQADKRILVALATVFVAAESYLLPFAKRQEYPEQPPYYPSPCQLALMNCTAPLQENPLLRSGPSNPRLLMSRLDEICPIYESVAICLRSHASECEQQTRTEIERGLSVGDFLCSVQGRSLVRESMQSVCYTDQIMETVLEGAIRLCIEESSTQEEAEQPTRCNHVRLAVSCVVQTGTEVCGQAVGELLNEIRIRILPLILGEQCSNEAPHATLKRAFEWYDWKRGVL